MAESGQPTLEVGFSIETSGSFSELQRLQAMMDSTEGKMLTAATQIEQATRGMVGQTATANVVAFGNAATRAGADAARALRSAETAGEALSRSMERQIDNFGKTKDQIRAARVEVAALAAAEQGLTELSGRLHAQNAAIEEQAQSLRSASLAYNMFEAAARKGVAVMREADAAAASAAMEKKAQDLRSATLAYNMFEAAARKGGDALRETEAATARATAEAAVNAQLLERSRIQAALERNTGVGKIAATDQGATFSALAAKAAEDEARADASAAAAAKRLADEHERLAAMVRGSYEAQMADVAAAERMRAATDPLYAATQRLNAEIAESTRLYHNGATAPAEYARQQQVLSQRMAATTEQHTAMAKAGSSNANAMRNLAIQMPDVVQGLLTGQKPFTILIQQGGQLVQVAMMAEGGLKAMAVAIGGLAVAAAPFIVVGAAAFGAFKLFQSQVKDSKELTRYRESLGLTHKEMLQLSDGVDKAGDKIERLSGVTVTAGDMMAGIWKTIQDGMGKSSDWDAISKGAVSAFKKVLAAWNVVAAGITAGINGTFDVVRTVWSAFPAVFGDLFVQGVNAAIGALNRLTKAGVDQLNGLITTVNKATGLKIGTVSAPQIDPVANGNAGAAAKAAKMIGSSYTNAYSAARKADAEFWKQSGNNAISFAKKRMAEEAAALKANRTAPKPKVDRNALAAEGVEAEIRNLYKLADAYGVSGAAALIAEARVKAETQAIKQRGDIEAAVDRQVRLSIAQRVADAEKTSAATRDQARIQTEVNALVANGLAPAERAAELVQQRVAELPLLAAAEAAAQRAAEAGAQGNISREKEMSAAADRATQALKAQRAAQADAKAAATGAFYIGADEAATRQLASLTEERRLIGATVDERVRAMATIQATQALEARGETLGTAYADAYIAKQVEIAVATQKLADEQQAYNDGLSFTADKWDLIARNVQTASQGMADAFGSVGRAIGDMASAYASFQADRTRLDQQHAAALAAANGNEKLKAQANTKFALASATAQIGAFGDMTAAAKGFFNEKSKGYQTMLAAEKVFRAVEFALSVKAMAQDAIHTASSVAKSAIRAAASGVEAVAKAIASLPFPANIAAGAATIAALAAIGVSVVGGLGGGSKGTVVKANDGTGTVLGDSSAKSDSIKNAVDALKEVDTLTNTFARQMAASLRSIDSQIGNVASLVSRAGDVNASAGVTEGFKPNLIGSVLSKIPLIGGLLGSLFGSTTTVTGSGLYGGAQSIGSILGGGFNAQYYSDVEKKSKFFGIVTGTKTSTQYTGADATLQNQFTLILKQFNDSIVAAAGPLGSATSEIQNRLNGFVVNIGKIDLKGLTGTEIQEKLSAVFGAAADNMANAAFPGIERFQKVGEGAFETLVRVASTVEAVTNAMDQLGAGAQALGIDAKMGLANQFASISDLTSAVDGYFQAFYTSEEQATAKQAQLARVFGSLGVAMPGTLAAFRSLVEAQDLTTAAGQSTYATLLQLAPAFADLQKSMEGAKSAADIASERNDLQRQLLTLQGNTAAIRALDLAKIDSSNRALQEQVWAIQDAQDAAKAADELRAAWTSVGDSIMDEVKRIRGLTGTNGGTSFVSLMGQFNAATAAARGGDQDAAKSLPQLSQSLLAAAALVATSRQELDRVQAQTAASLEATNAAISNLATTVTPTTSVAAILANAATVQASTAPAASNDDMASELRSLRDELAQLRADNNAGHAATASNTGSLKRSFDSVTAASGGEAISVAAAA
ncbi:hypothetical protein [Sphingomonas sp. CARO-RG-8B-R24-01]|uniref:hypothetical protein n=1 Tax=Sphingomonas sp. CARO-RG-8B-R24-01 TaxID=2914831 RepID=UPI001F5A88ED|nr:hypothetical protein [Sphingomonas sp. CARO-RG-8B-R24-01]